MRCNAATPTATERRENKNKALHHQLPSFVILCPLATRLSELSLLTNQLGDTAATLSPFLPPSTASVNVYLSHSAACCSVCLSLFSWRQSNHCHERNDRQRNNWGTGTLWSVSLQPIIITRGQAECPSPVDRWALWIQPGFSLQLLHQHAHIANRGVFAAAWSSNVKAHCMYCKESVVMKTTPWRGKVKKKKKDVRSRLITCCCMTDNHMMFMVVFQLLQRSEE